MYSEFDFIYFTEADQILRLRSQQLKNLIAVASRDDKAVFMPHRFATFPRFHL
jgi:regulation of enolase protein 1 (concanavalin A-like superfamily)